MNDTLHCLKYLLQHTGALDKKSFSQSDQATEEARPF
jgi:hypothetical protein